MAADLTNDSVVLSIPTIPADRSGYVRQSAAVAGQLSPAVLAYISAAVADNTRRAYRQDLIDFHRWGGIVPCTPETLAAFIADRAAVLSAHSISRRVVGIGKAHTSCGLPDPAKSDLVRSVLRGVRWTHGTAQRQAMPLLTRDLMALLPLMVGMAGIRDRALILLGFGAALRRSELVALDRVDLEFVSEGLLVHVRRSKTDQQGAGRSVAVPCGATQACPVKAVSQWLTQAQIADSAVFRSVNKTGQVGTQRLTAQSVSLIVKRYAQSAGLPASKYSGHSLRAGLVTSAAQAGVATHRIMAQTGHRSLATLHRYIRDADQFRNNAVGALL